MKIETKWFVILQPQVITLFDSIKDTVVSSDGVISCTAIEHGMSYLEMTAIFHDPHDPPCTIKFSIPHSIVLSILEATHSLNKTLGFRGFGQTIETEKD